MYGYVCFCLYFLTKSPDTLVMTQFLKNLFCGASTVLDVFPTGKSGKCYNPAPHTDQALQNHWKNVGQFMQGALNQYDKENQQNQKR